MGISFLGLASRLPSVCLAPSILSLGQLGVSQVQPMLLLNKNPPVPTPATL